MPPTLAELDQLMYEHELVQEYLKPSPYFEAALAYDQDYASGGEHPVLRRLREGPDPVFRSGGSPAGVNDMNGFNNGGGARLRDLDVRGANNYDQEEDQPEKMDPQTLIGLVELCLRGIDDPGERSEFLQELANLLTGSGYANGNNNDNNGDYDYDQMSTMPSSSPPPQRPSYNSSFNGRGTVDRRPRGSRGDARRANDRALAMDSTVRSLNAASFQRRWGAQTSHIRLTGNCR
jgi:hypothetical protein